MKSKQTSPVQHEQLNPEKENHTGRNLLIGSLSVLAIGAICYMAIKKGKKMDIKPAPKPPVNTNLPEKQIVEEMKANENAQKIYADINQKCDGKLDVTVANRKSDELQKLGEYYKKQEILSSMPQEFEAFKEEVQDKSIKELWKLKFKIMDKKKVYHKKIQGKQNTSIHVKYPQKSNSANEIDRAILKNLEEKENYLKQLIETKKTNVLEKHLMRSGDKKVKTRNLCQITRDEDELRAFSEYYDNYPLNSTLRRGEDVEGARSIKCMDNVFKKAPALEEEAVVYRSVHGHPIFEEMNKFIDTIKEGAIIEDKSYVSTSTNISNGQFRQFANCVLDGDTDGVLMRIRLPKGTRGVLGGYDEYLLPRNNKIKVNKIDIVDGYKIADCEYILP